MAAKDMVSVNCPLCEKKADCRVLYNQNFAPEKLSENPCPDLQRPIPHYRIVKCSVCGLVYSSPILKPELVHDLYQTGSSWIAQNYELEADNVNRAYFRHLKKAMKINPSRGRLLDIGCGNGFFLRLCLKEGFKEVHGVEPSTPAFEQVPKNLRGRVRNDIFRPADFAKERARGSDLTFSTCRDENLGFRLRGFIRPPGFPPCAPYRSPGLLYDHSPQS